LDIQHFRFSDHATRNKVSDASMFIWVPEMSRPVRVRVYRVVGNATEHQSMMVLLAASSKLTDQREPGWVELDTRKLITEWFKSPHDNLGVVVKLEDSSGHSIPYPTDLHDTEEFKVFHFLLDNAVLFHGIKIYKYDTVIKKLI
jgi:hypothetical protein